MASTTPSRSILNPSGRPDICTVGLLMSGRLLGIRMLLEAQLSAWLCTACPLHTADWQLISPVRCQDAAFMSNAQYASYQASEHTFFKQAQSVLQLSPGTLALGAPR